MTKHYVLALDQGTSSSRAILFDHDQEIVGSEQVEFSQYYPKVGWVEHNPHEIWQSQFMVAKTLISRLKIDTWEIVALGITNQRETTIVWDKRTGEPIYNAIVWQDKRTSDYCNQLKEEGWATYVQEATGLLIDSYFSATKLHWILENVEGARDNAKKGNLLFGTVDTWLAWKLSGGKLHITDYSNASRTMLFNIDTLEWDKKLLELFDIPSIMLPEVRQSSEIYGHTDSELFNLNIPIAGIAGDQQAALFGQDCFSAGMAKNTYGTGCFMLMNTGEKRIVSPSGLLTTIAWGINGKIEYALEGSVFIAGAAVKWLRDGIKLIRKSSETEAIAEKLESTEGVYVVPAFSGLGAPYWDMYARGAIFGLTQGVTDEHIIRATLESLAYQTRDVLDVMTKDSGIQLKALNVDGGASANNFLLQFQTDILQTPVIRPKIIETTALGAAALAGLAVNFWTKEELLSKREIDREFVPAMSEENANEKYRGWQKAVKRTMNWEKKENNG